MDTTYPSITVKLKLNVLSLACDCEVLDVPVGVASLKSCSKGFASSSSWNKPLSSHVRRNLVGVGV